MNRLSPLLALVLVISAPVLRAGEDRTIYTCLDLKEAIARYGLAARQPQVPISAVSADAAHFIFADAFGSGALAGELGKPKPPGIALRKESRPRAVGFLGSRPVLEYSLDTFGMRDHTICGAIIDGGKAIELVWPALAGPNVRVRQRGVLVCRQGETPSVVVWAAMGRRGFAGSEQVFLLARFAADGALGATHESVRPANDPLYERLNTPGADAPLLAWADPDRGRLLVRGWSEITQLSQKPARSQWGQGVFAHPHRPANGEFITLAIDEQNKPAATEHFGVVLASGQIIGAFTSDRWVQVKRWTVGDGDLPTAPTATIATRLPGWFLDRQQRRSFLDAGDGILVVGGSMLHEGASHEMVGIVDLTAKEPVFVPLLAAGSALPVDPSLGAWATRREEGRIDLVLSSMNIGHLLLPCSDKGLLPPAK